MLAIIMALFVSFQSFLTRLQYLHVVFPLPSQTSVVLPRHRNKRQLNKSIHDFVHPDITAR